MNPMSHEDLSVDEAVEVVQIEDLGEAGVSAGWCIGTAGTFGCTSTFGSYGCLS